MYLFVFEIEYSVPNEPFEYLSLSHYGVFYIYLCSW